MNKIQTVFLFPRGIKMQLSDAVAQNYAMSFKAICKCSTMETRVLSIFADHTTFLAEKIHIVERSKGRLSRDRPIMVSEQSPVLYVWTGQGRQAFEVHLSSEEYGRAICRSPEDVNATLSVEPTPFVIPAEPEGTKVVEVLDPEMIRCLLAFKKSLQSPRQVSVTVARCQEVIATHGHLDAVSLYQQWFVNMMVAIQPHTSANIARIRIDHARLEALLIRAGYAFNDQGYLTTSEDQSLPVLEQLPPAVVVVQESQDQWVGTDVASTSPLLALLPEGCTDPVGYLTDFFNQILVK